MTIARAYLALALCLAGPALADAPETSARPDLRPGGDPVALVPDLPGRASPATPSPASPAVTRLVVSASALAPRGSLRPPARPGADPESVRPSIPASVASAPPPTTTPAPQIERQGLFGGLLRPQGEPRVTRSGGGGLQLAVMRSLRPGMRPAGLVQRVRATATRNTPGRVAQPGTRGALCGIPDLIGERLAPIPGRIDGCGIAEPIRLREVAGVTLSTPATINCDAALALRTWLNEAAIPAVGRRGGGITSLRVVASYACRTRNNQPGARVSEHGRGNAIDIAGVGLANGSELTVLSGWRDNRVGPILQQLHRGACGPFGTVLGPNADRFHQDHFHFDVAGYRSGPYCR